jgi:hypothetical protein
MKRERKIVRAEWVSPGATSCHLGASAGYVLVYYPELNRHCAYFGVYDGNEDYEISIRNIADWGGFVRQEVAEAIFDVKFDDYGPV